MHFRLGLLYVSYNRGTLFIDWRIFEPGKRWRLQFEKPPMWFPMDVPAPTRHGKNWAYWAKGNEHG